MSGEGGWRPYLAAYLLNNAATDRRVEKKVCGTISAVDQATRSQDERWMYDSAEKETVAETYFRYHGESQKIAHETHYGYEDLSPVTLPEEVRI